MPWVDDPSLALLVLMFLPNVLVFLHLVVTDCVYRTWALLQEDEARDGRNDANLGGHRRRGGGRRRRGVSDEARRGWEHFAWGEGQGASLGNEEGAIAAAEVGAADYGSINGATPEGGDDSLSEMEGGKLLPSTVDAGQPCCSICLNEYMPGETVVRLPCGHLYHEPCIHSWTDNHVRCPLCNFDLREDSKNAMTV